MKGLVLLSSNFWTILNPLCTVVPKALSQSTEFWSTNTAAQYEQHFRTLALQARRAALPHCLEKFFICFFSYFLVFILHFVYFASLTFFLGTCSSHPTIDWLRYFFLFCIFCGVSMYLRFELNFRESNQDLLSVNNVIGSHLTSYDRMIWSFGVLANIANR